MALIAHQPEADAPAPPPTFLHRLAAVGAFFRSTLAGRLLLAGGVLKLVMWGLQAFDLGPLRGGDAASTFGGILLACGVGVLLYRLSLSARKRLLWRVRRKLILSYIFIGVVPTLLIVTFFLLFGLLLFANLSSFLIRSALADLSEEAGYVARTVALEIEHGASDAAVRAVLERRVRSDTATYPGVSITAVPVDARRCPSVLEPTAPPAAPHGSGGPWTHLAPPAAIPPWVACEGFAGVLAHTAPGAAIGNGQPDAHVTVRAVAFPEHASGFAVVVDLPFTEGVRTRIEDSTGIAIGSVSLVDSSTLALRSRFEPAESPVAGDARGSVWRMGDREDRGVADARRLEHLGDLPAVVCGASLHSRAQLRRPADGDAGVCLHPVSDHRDWRAGHGACPRAFDYRIGARAVRRNRARPGG
jgi:hypothetical protein